MSQLYVPSCASLYGTCRCAALDEIGDTSSEEERRKYFHDVDLDNSEGIDFEEFISVSG